jgi:hypothetical protein
VPTVKTQMTEMKSATVDRISLVAKASSRIPFRVIKEDRSAMTNPLKTLDLAQVFKGKKADPVPTIVGVVTMKGATFEAVKKAAAEAGFKVETVVENSDGSVVLKQADSAEGEKLVVIKMGDVAVTMKGFAPYNCVLDVSGDGDSTVSFAEMCSAQGFYPDVSTVMDVLQTSVMQAAYKAEDPKSASETVAKMFDEAKAYAVTLMSALPAACFKMEKTLKAAPNANGSMATAEKLPAAADGTTVTANLGGATQKDPMAGQLPGSASAATGTGDGSQVAKGGEGVAAIAATTATTATTTATSATAEPAKKAEGEAAAAAATEVVDPGAALSKLLSEGLATLSSTLKTQLDEVAGQVKKSVDEVKTEVGGLTQKMEKVEGVAKAAHLAATGTVLGSDAGADAHQTTQKSEQQGYRGREIDTGFTPRRRTAAAR